MLGFLQGAAYGLFLTCLPWCLVGLASPRLAVPSEHPTRWQAVVRYAFLAPFLSLLMWLTSLWGGFDPSLAGWLAGLAGIAVEIPLERRWRRFRARRHKRRLEAMLQAEADRRRAEASREAGVSELDPAAPPADADEVVQALCRAKQALVEVGRDDHAAQVDRLYSRYRHVLEVLGSRFDATELAHERARSLVEEVCYGAVDTFTAMASQARGVQGLDVEFIRRRLGQEADRLSANETSALRRRLALIEDTERSLRRLAARNEAALTALDDTSVALSRIVTDRPRARVGADQACEELRRFIDGAGRYGRETR
ncbi:cobyrinic acid a,c-diamide synthase [Halomonas koreensis]|uniref:Cobyrinic acid a,c-diamide synthase n=1 Tax=Halomonas koreensis TaxID=245385 RepID=A0ABU1FWV6_9GAMM|nr:cobyrinic acid a,c-diamide synthase [Halomonas koreensis]MDR5865172.1 cobyrinic acid a,c-diamide synthase [Halomonas koreensis]